MASASLAEALAGKVQASIDALSRSDPTYPPSTLAERGVLIIVDRGIDVAAPLLHEFTYQAFVADMLDVTSRYCPEDGGQEIILDESDPVWVENRFKHIAKVIEHLSHGVKKELSGNKAGQFEKGYHSQGGSGLSNIQDLKDALSSLPQYQEMKVKYSIHTELCSKAMDVYTRGNIERISCLEQDLVMSDLTKAKTAKRLYSEVLKVLDDGSIEHVNKVRIVLLYVCAVQGTQDSERDALYQRAQLSVDEAQAVTNLSILGIKLSAQVDKRPDDANPYSLRNVASRAMATPEFENSKFTPVLDFVLRDQIQNRIPHDAFSWLKEPPPQHERPATWAGTHTNSGVVRGTSRTKPSWATKRTTMELDSSKPVERSPTVAESSSGPRTVLFVIGGMSWSEIRACHRVAEEMHREIVIGSTRLLTPTATMDMLAELHHSSPFRRPRNPFSPRSQVSPHNASSARQVASIPQSEYSGRDSPNSQDRVPARFQHSVNRSADPIPGPRTAIGSPRTYSIPKHAQYQPEATSSTRSASLANSTSSPMYGSRQESRGGFSDPQLDQSNSHKEKSRWFSKRK